MSQNETPQSPPAQQLDPASLDQVVGGATTATTDARAQEQNSKLLNQESSAK